MVRKPDRISGDPRKSSSLHDCEQKLQEFLGIFKILQVNYADTVWFLWLDLDSDKRNDKNYYVLHVSF